MIVGAHPIVKALENSEWRFHLIGSRYCGVYDEKSDYDFIAECSYARWREPVYNQKKEKKEETLQAFLKRLGFECNGTSGYGLDRRLHGTNVWTWTDPDKKLPPVDVLPMEPKEAEMRLQFFRELKRMGNKRGGLFMLAMKSDKNWSKLWQILAAWPPRVSS